MFEGSTVRGVGGSTEAAGGTTPFGACSPECEVWNNSSSCTTISRSRARIENGLHCAFTPGQAQPGDTTQQPLMVSGCPERIRLSSGNRNYRGSTRPDVLNASELSSSVGRRIKPRTFHSH